MQVLLKNISKFYTKVVQRLRTTLSFAQYFTMLFIRLILCRLHNFQLFGFSFKIRIIFVKLLCSYKISVPHHLWGAALLTALSGSFGHLCASRNARVPLRYASQPFRRKPAPSRSLKATWFCLSNRFFTGNTL